MRPEDRDDEDKAAIIQAMLSRSVEASVHTDQKDVEMKLLAGLTTVINSDLPDLKYDILAMDESDFHFRDHRAIFAAMKTLADAGDHVDEGTVKVKLGDAWTDAMKAIFDAAKADASVINSAKVYKRQVIHWANVEHARGIVNAATRCIS